jgi:hypothetical protein
LTRFCWPVKMVSRPSPSFFPSWSSKARVMRSCFLVPLSLSIWLFFVAQAEDLHKLMPSLHFDHVAHRLSVLGSSRKVKVLELVIHLFSCPTHCLRFPVVYCRWPSRSGREEVLWHQGRD